LLLANGHGCDLTNSDSLTEMDYLPKAELKVEVMEPAVRFLI